MSAASQGDDRRFGRAEQAERRPPQTARDVEGQSIHPVLADDVAFAIPRQGERTKQRQSQMPAVGMPRQLHVNAGVRCTFGNIGRMRQKQFESVRWDAAQRLTQRWTTVPHIIDADQPEIAAVPRQAAMLIQQQWNVRQRQRSMQVCQSFPVVVIARARHRRPSGASNPRSSAEHRELPSDG
jgi:hypothetical protein